MAVFFIFIFLSLSQDLSDIASIKKILRFTYLCDFDSADMELFNYRLKQKGSLAPDCYSHFVKQSHFKDMEVSNESSSDSLIQAIENSISELENRKKTPWDLYLQGNLYFIKAAEENRLKNNYTALRDGYSAIDLLESALEKDSTLSDSKLGIGVFKYWKSVYTLYIPFFADEREEGIQLIDESSTSLLSSKLAKDFQMIYILIEEEKYEEALSISKQNSYNYPRARFFLWAHAEVLYKLNQFMEAYEIYRSLYFYYKNKSAYNEIELQRKMAICLKNSGEYKQALQCIQIAKKLPTYDILRLRDKYDNVLDLEDDIMDLLNDKD